MLGKVWHDVVSITFLYLELNPWMSTYSVCKGIGNVAWRLKQQDFWEESVVGGGCFQLQGIRAEGCGNYCCHRPMHAQQPSHSARLYRYGSGVRNDACRKWPGENQVAKFVKLQTLQRVACGSMLVSMREEMRKEEKWEEKQHCRTLPGLELKRIYGAFLCMLWYSKRYWYFISAYCRFLVFYSLK